MSELILKARIESLAVMLLPSLKNFPRFEKHGMVAEIRSMTIRLMTSIQLAESVKSKRSFYAQAA